METPAPKQEPSYRAYQMVDFKKLLEKRRVKRSKPDYVCKSCKNCKHDINQRLQPPCDTCTFEQPMWEPKNSAPQQEDDRP